MSSVMKIASSLVVEEATIETQAPIARAFEDLVAFRPTLRGHALLRVWVQPTFRPQRAYVLLDPPFGATTATLRRVSIDAHRTHVTQCEENRVRSMPVQHGVKVADCVLSELDARALLAPFRTLSIPTSFESGGGRDGTTYEIAFGAGYFGDLRLRFWEAGPPEWKEAVRATRAVIESFDTLCDRA